MSQSFLTACASADILRGMIFGSLFSGVGGLDLGLEAAGWTCAFQVEIDGFCRHVLSRRWPTVPRFEDIRTLKGAYLPRVDLLAGGFPCQGVSNAGKRAGLRDARSGLWFEYARLIDEIRPRFVLVENVPGLVNRGLREVLGSLAELGYDAEWTILSAAMFGAPHLRKRLFLVAYRQQQQLRDEPRGRGRQGGPGTRELGDDGSAERVAHGHGHGREERRASHGALDVGKDESLRDDADRCDTAMAHADSEGPPIGLCFGGVSREEFAAFVRNRRPWEVSQPGLGGAPDGDASGSHAIEPWERGTPRAVARARGSRESFEDRLRLGALGNAVVPICAEWVGHRLALCTTQSQIALT
jgi:site-specific DNA-cytosine methylase